MVVRLHVGTLEPADYPAYSHRRFVEEEQRNRQHDAHIVVLNYRLVVISFDIIFKVYVIVVELSDEILLKVIVAGKEDELASLIAYKRAQDEIKEAHQDGQCAQAATHEAEAAASSWPEELPPQPRVASMARAYSS